MFSIRKTEVLSEIEKNYLISLPPNDFKSTIYSTHYSDWIYKNRGNARFHRAMHKALERGHSGVSFRHTLEIGARNLEHFSYVKHDFQSYTLTDIDDLTIDVPIWKSVNPKICFIKDDISSSSLHSNSYDRIILTCVLHHVPEFESALNEIRRVAKSGAIIDILLPCDPGLIYRLLKSLGPYRHARKGNYLEIKKLLDARDHINHFGGILAIIKFVFKNDQVAISLFPFKYLPYDFNLWATIRITKC